MLIVAINHVGLQATRKATRIWQNPQNHKRVTHMDSITWRVGYANPYSSSSCQTAALVQMLQRGVASCPKARVDRAVPCSLKPMVSARVPAPAACRQFVFGRTSHPTSTSQALSVKTRAVAVEQQTSTSSPSTQGRNWSDLDFSMLMGKAVVRVPRAPHLLRH